jgi:hypothetical protein
MVRVYALSVVATVANQKSFRYWTLVDDIRQSVSAPIFTLERQATVTATVYVAQPFPTIPIDANL